MVQLGRMDFTMEPTGAARSAAIIFALICFGLGIAGCATETHRAAARVDRTDATAKPFVDCRGSHNLGPTVFLEAGAFSTSADWSLILRDLARSGRVCAYDRLGLGLSPDRSSPPTAEQIARELAATLDQLGEAAPIILVGHSNGAFYAETFATLFPDRVAGLVYVNGVGTDDLDAPQLISQLESERTQADLAAVGGRLGVARWFVDPKIAAIGLDGQGALRKSRALTSSRFLADARDEVMEILPALRRVRELGDVPPTIPVAVVVGALRQAPAPDEAWRAAEVAPATRACQGWVLDAIGASHVSPLGRDRSYVIAAVRWLKTPGLKAAAACTDAVFKR
ncbi:MAG: alpha/beta hydrolase [Phenylobacterium sp.]|nr:MAG: alpha/beta hydrolase [Phenylobacterium sp.]